MELELTALDGWGLGASAETPLIIAGPCSAESEEQLMQTAAGLKRQGIGILRAGLWKPRTRPNSFEGVGEAGLPWMQLVRQELGMKVATEVANARHVEQVLKAGLDMLWIGARTTANPFAVQEVAEALRGVDIPVLVKNPVNPDVELWIGGLERLNLVGVKKLAAVHRGFSTYGRFRYRNMPQWQLPIEVCRRLPGLPMICDPSHISGKRIYLKEISQKAMDLGFDGLIIESHICPERALSDAEQQLTPDDLRLMLEGLVFRKRESEDTEFRENMDELRTRIDVIDSGLLDLLSDRMLLSDEIGRYKKQKGITILQPDRWEGILAKVCEGGKEKGLDEEFLKKVFRAIHQASIDRQTRIMNG